MMISNGRGLAVPAESFSQLAVGTMVTTDLVAARRFYEEFFGFDCVRYAPDRMLIRDSHSKQLMERGERNFFVIDVAQVSEVVHPQNVLNHWGFSLASREEVDRVRAEALARQQEYGIRKIMGITTLHDAYGFFMADRDMNWWEIEFRVHGRTNEMLFDQGDCREGA